MQAQIMTLAHHIEHSTVVGRSRLPRLTPHLRLIVVASPHVGHLGGRRAHVMIAVVKTGVELGLLLVVTDGAYKYSR